MNEEDLGNAIQRLSPSLELLELQCAEAEKCLLQPVEELGWMFCNTDEMPPPSDVDGDGDGGPATRPGSGNSQRLRTWGATFPSLKTLILRANCPSLEVMDMLELPQTLTRFQLLTEGHNGLADHPEILPRGLQSLRVAGFAAWTQESMNRLPPTLGEFLMDDKVGMVRWDDKSAFPQSLVSLGAVRLNITPDVLRSLPPHLESLRVHRAGNMDSWISPSGVDASHGSSSSSSSWVSLLPKTLALFKLGAGNQVAAEQLALNLLPQTIRTLALPRIDWNINSSPMFPPQLTYLKVFKCDNWTLAHWSMLPEAGLLKTLYVTCSSESPIPIEAFALLPRSLTKLEIHAILIPWTP